MKKLYRLSGDRKIAGVCAGLGEHFDIDPVIIRLFFLVSVFFGGLGVLAYVIMWILVPLNGGSPAEQTIRPRLHLSSRVRHRRIPRQRLRRSTLGLTAVRRMAIGQFEQRL